MKYPKLEKEKRTMAKRIGIDIGYSTVRAVTFDPKETYYEQPALIALDATGRVSACGEEAVALSERLPGAIKTVRPFSGETMPDPAHAYAYFSFLFRRLKQKGAKVYLSLSGKSDKKTEQLFAEAAQKAGAGTVTIIDAFFAAANGCGVKGAGDSAIVNIGASVTDMGCFSHGKPVAVAGNNYAGNSWDRAVSAYILRNHRLSITREESERLKIAIGTLTPDGERTEEVTVSRPGFGLPKKLTVKDTALAASLEETLDALTDEIVAMTRPLAVEPDKVILTGGSARLSGLAPALAPLLCLPVEVAPEPEKAVIRGLAFVIKTVKGKAKEKE